MTRLAITTSPHPAPTAPDVRAQLIAEPLFGRVFSDHMISIRYAEGTGWHDARLLPRGPIAMDPATSVLHYAQEIFEGMKAYRLDDGALALFRPDANARRFNASARRMAMAEIDEGLFVDAISALVRADCGWFPPGSEGALYLRPFMYASEVFLGVKPAAEYHFVVIASPVGPYFKGDAPAVSLLVSDDYSRAAPGGTGAAKCGGNYAASLAAQQQAIARGFDQVVFLDAVERRWVEELGGMNLFFVFADGSIQTPPLSGTILPGITRDALLVLARDAGLEVREAPYAIDAWAADAASGRLTEAFACGTAAVVTPVGSVTRGSDSFSVGGGAGGQVTQMLKQRLVDIQRGRAPDPYGWTVRLDVAD